MVFRSSWNWWRCLSTDSVILNGYVCLYVNCAKFNQRCVSHICPLSEADIGQEYHMVLKLVVCLDSWVLTAPITTTCLLGKLMCMAAKLNMTSVTIIAIVCSPHHCPSWDLHIHANVCTQTCKCYCREDPVVTLQVQVWTSKQGIIRVCLEPQDFYLFRKLLQCIFFILVPMGRLMTVNAENHSCSKFWKCQD